MLRITIEGEKYQCYSEWSDFNLETYIKLSKIEVPIKLKNIWIAEKDPDIKKAVDSIKEIDIKETFPEYYSDVISVLSNIPRLTISQLHEDLKTELFDNHLRKFILALLFYAPMDYEPDEIKSFKLNGQRFYFPDSLELYNEIIPMHNESVISFSEAADIDLSLEGQEWISKLPVFMGIYCRKKGEGYNDNLAISRSIMFEKVNMSIVWALLFLHRKAYARIVEVYPNVFKGSGGSTAEYKNSGLSNFGWRGMIYEVAEAGGIGTVDKVENTKLYDFMSYLSFIRAQGKFSELKQNESKSKRRN